MMMLNAITFHMTQEKAFTRSAAGRVEALLLTQKRTQTRSKRISASTGMTNHQQELDSSLRWNDEPRKEIKQRSSSCVG
jgi:hypothetical protein